MPVSKILPRFSVYDRQSVVDHTKSSKGQPNDDQHATSFESTAQQKVRKALTWFSWGMGGVAAKERIAGETMEEEMRTAKPGDILLCGGGGALTHVALYLGEGQILHSMATSINGRSFGERVMDTLEIVSGLDITRADSYKIGVIRESVKDFFNRFERDSFAIMRPTKLSNDRVKRGLEKVKKLEGQSYDYDFVPQNEAFYCSEIITEFMHAAGQQDFSISANQINFKLMNRTILERDALVEPSNFLRSPHLTLIKKSANAKMD